MERGSGEPLVRSYALSGVPGTRDSWRLGVLREDAGRGGSRALHGVAGGIGIRPLLSMARAVLARAAPASHVYVCGPRPLNEALIAAAAAAGWARERVHHEFFAAEAPAVGAGESVLDALLREGMLPLYDCKRGECGLCATTVLGGDVEHRDYVLSEADRRQRHQMCICVSRVRSGELVLDL